MLAKGDKLIVTKNVMGILKEGDIVEVVEVNDNLISVAFGENGMHMCMMSHDECEIHFEKYEEPKVEAPFVSEEYIEYIIDKSEVEVQTVFDKCTIVSCKLPNGFVIVESSSCVSPENYDEEVGFDICMDKIANKIWELEGYILQSKLYEKKCKEECECPYGCDNCNECPCDGECTEEDGEEYDELYVAGRVCW